MSGINLSLPIDIPWSLLATSHDMMDLTIGGSLPPKWRSSVAIFKYEPEISPDDTTDQAVCYLKVVCSITGFQSTRVRRRFFDFGSLPSPAVTNIRNKLGRYFACYGALLQVSVVPESADDRASLENYPIFTDMEPKRRDLYELVTDTGEVLSGSINRAAVNKGFTGSFNTETGWSLSGTASISPGTGGGAGGSLTGGASGKTSVGMQDQTLTQIDYSREKRESESHVTSLTQMYNLLQAYHVGTNRAVFLLLPRPHMAEEVEKRTFINGPREIEGIQEFLFLVSRPRSVEQICVEALLETGHLDLNPAEVEGLSSDTASFPFTFEAPRSIPHGDGLGDDSTSQSFSISRTYTPPTDWKVDVDKGSGGYVVLWTDGAAAYAVQANANGVVVSGTVVTKYFDVAFADDYYDYQDIKGELTIFIKKKSSVTTGEVKNTFFTTARTVIGCTQGPSPVDTSDWVSYEAPVVIDPKMSARTVEPKVRMQLANDLVKKVGAEMLGSLDEERRYEPGSVTFEESQFVLDRIVREARTPGARESLAPVLRQPIDKRGIDKNILDRLAPVVSASSPVEDLLAVPVSEIADLSGDGTLDSALKLKWKMLGLGATRRR